MQSVLIDLTLAINLKPPSCPTKSYWVTLAWSGQTPFALTDPPVCETGALDSDSVSVEALLGAMAWKNYPLGYCGLGTGLINLDACDDKTISEGSLANG